MIPDHYVKYCEPVNDEVQNTLEKNWTFKEKNFEVTQEMIKKIKECNIDISPEDLEWVIDCWEKLAVND